jgi:hypothetical protein
VPFYLYSYVYDVLSRRNITYLATMAYRLSPSNVKLKTSGFPNVIRLLHILEKADMYISGTFLTIQHTYSMSLTRPKSELSLCWYFKSINVV